MRFDPRVYLRHALIPRSSPPFSCTNWPNSTCKSWPQTGYVTACSLINPFQFSLKYWRVCVRPAHFGRAPWNCEISAISRSNRWSLFLLINGKGAVYPMYSTNLSKNLSSFASQSSLCSRTNFLISYLIGKISGTRQKMRWTSSYDLIFLRLEFQYWQTFRDFVFELILIWFDFILRVFFSFLWIRFDIFLGFSALTNSLRWMLFCNSIIGLIFLGFGFHLILFRRVSLRDTWTNLGERKMNFAQWLSAWK